MSLIGRKQEIDMLDRCLYSGRPEFVAVYGRRRIGKTFLVRQYFKNSFSFYATGIADANMAHQLRAFGLSLKEYGSSDRTVPKDWFDAFDRLRELLSARSVRRDRASGRRVVFLDELPWFDTQRSGFKGALDWFWNGWASAQPDLMLVICGSAASWIIDNLLEDHGGFYNRVTRRIQLMPFSLKESEALLLSNGVELPRQQIIECYMVFGGIPHYLNLVDRRSSLAQNIDQLCFFENGELRHERDLLFKSLFKHDALHQVLICKLAERPIGLTRSDLSRTPGVTDGKQLTKALLELERCGFVRKYRRYGKEKYGHYYQLIDAFTLFSHRFVELATIGSWTGFLNTPPYHAWTGLAFELTCLVHIPQIKQALGVGAVQSSQSAWHSTSASPGAQVDLLIDRKDGVINLCEIKYSTGEFAIDAGYERNLRNKMQAFVSEEHPNKAIHLTMVTTCGITHNSHAGIVVNEICGDDLFG